MAAVGERDSARLGLEVLFARRRVALGAVTVGGLGVSAGAVGLTRVGPTSSQPWPWLRRSPATW